MWTGGKMKLFDSEPQKTETTRFGFSRNIHATLADPLTKVLFVIAVLFIVIITVVVGRRDTRIPVFWRAVINIDHQRNESLLHTQSTVAGWLMSDSQSAKRTALATVRDEVSTWNKLRSDMCLVSADPEYSAYLDARCTEYELFVEAGEVYLQAMAAQSQAAHESLVAQANNKLEAVYEMSLQAHELLPQEQ